MKLVLPVFIIVLSFGLSGCQTTGVMTDEWVRVKTDGAWLDMSAPLRGVDSYSVYAKADWRQYSEVHSFEDADYYGSAWLGALQSRWQWNATDNAADFQKQLLKWNRFEETAPVLGRIRKDNFAGGPVVYSIGRFKQDDCLFVMRFLNRNQSDDTKYRVQVVGYVCRNTGGRYTNDEANAILESINVRNTAYNGTGIEQEALAESN